MSTINPKVARLNKGLTVAELASRLHDVDEGAIYRLERGMRIAPAKAKRIADFYGVDVTDFPAFAPDAAPAARAA